jgi:NitT/TauT family transport system substrate-binding protein
VRRCFDFALVGSLLALASCARGPSPPVRIAIGGQSQLIYLAATLAEELGYYREEGVGVALIDFPGGAKALEALIGGSADVVCGFYDHTIQMAAQGRELQAFVAMLRYPGLVAVAAAPKIARIEDLKGHTVGVSAAGSSTHMLLNYLLATHGLKAEDVSTASIGMSATAVAAITHAKVDAAMMTDPALAIARKQLPSLRILADTRTVEGVRAVFGVESYPSAVLYSSKAWIGEHADAAGRLARAVLRTLAWMRSHSPEEIRARMPASFRTEDAQMDFEGLRSLQAMLSPDGRVTAEAAAAVYKVLSASLEAVRTRRIDLEATYTDRFLR